MHRKLLLLILTLLPLQVLGQSRGFVVSPLNAEAAVQEQKLLQGIEFLSSEVCEGRASGTKGHFMAAEWIRFSLKRAGVVPFDGCWADGFNLEGGGTGHNVLGQISVKLFKYFLHAFSLQSLCKVIIIPVFKSVKVKIP